MDETNRVGTSAKLQNKAKALTKAKRKKALLKAAGKKCPKVRKLYNLADIKTEIDLAGVSNQQDKEKIYLLAKNGFEPHEAVRIVLSGQHNRKGLHKLLDEKRRAETKQAILKEEIQRRQFSFAEQFKTLRSHRANRAKWLLENGFTEREAIALVRGPPRLIGRRSRVPVPRDAASGISEPKRTPIPVRVIHTDYPRVCLTPQQMKKIEELIVRTQHKVKVQGVAMTPQIGGMIPVAGYWLVVCFDTATTQWLHNRMCSVPWKAFAVRTITKKEMLECETRKGKNRKRQRGRNRNLSPSLNSAVRDTSFPQRKKANQTSGMNDELHQDGRRVDHVDQHSKDVCNRSGNPKSDDRCEDNEGRRASDRSYQLKYDHFDDTPFVANDRFVDSKYGYLSGGNDRSRYGGASSIGEKRKFADLSEDNYLSQNDRFGINDVGNSNNRRSNEFAGMSAYDKIDDDRCSRRSNDRFGDNHGFPSSRSQLKYDDYLSDRIAPRTADYGARGNAEFQSYDSRYGGIRSVDQFDIDPYNRFDQTTPKDFFGGIERSHSKDHGSVRTSHRVRNAVDQLDDDPNDRFGCIKGLSSDARHNRSDYRESDTRVGRHASSKRYGGFAGLSDPVSVGQLDSGFSNHSNQGPADRFRSTDNFPRTSNQRKYDDYPHARSNRLESPDRFRRGERAHSNDRRTSDEDFHDRNEIRKLYERIQRDEARLRNDCRLLDRQRHADSYDRGDNRPSSDSSRSQQRSQNDKFDSSSYGRSDYRRFGDDRGSRNSSRDYGQKHADHAREDDRVYNRRN